MTQSSTADTWTPPDPEEIAEARENVTPDDSNACMTLGAVLLDTRDPLLRREAILWIAQAALLEEADAHYYLAQDCRALKMKDLGQAHLQACEYSSTDKDAARQLDEWRREDPDQAAEINTEDPDSCLAMGEALLATAAPSAKDEALEWFIQAMLGGEPGGHYHLALYWQEVGNAAMADSHLRTAARRGHEAAATLLCGGESEAIFDLRERSRNDDPEACYQLAEALVALDAQRYREEALELLKTAARRDHAGAQYRVALHYRQEGEPTDAGYYLRGAAEQGYEPAEKLLIEWKIEGYHAFEDNDEALQLLEDGVGRGLNAARFRLADWIRQGRGTEIDPACVAGLYTQAAEDGHAPSMYELAVCYQRGYGVAVDSVQSRQWMQEAAGRKDPDGLCGLGMLYREECDHGNAVSCLEGAASMGVARAMHALALAYGRGEGVERDEARMRGLIAQAAEKDHPESQFLVGGYYAQGVPGFERNDEHAAEWYDRAASQNYPQALRALGELTLRAPGRKKKDTERAWNYLSRAANQGDVESMMRVAVGFDSRENPESRGMDRASRAYITLYWYQRAADAGNIDAQFTVGKRMLDTPHDRERARAYLESAARKGHAEARALLDQLGPEPEPEVPDSAGLVAAATQGDPASQYSLAMWHYSGYGVAQSFPLCYFWGKVMARTLPDEAAGLVEMASTQVASGLRRKIDRQAAAWKPGSPPPEL